VIVILAIFGITAVSLGIGFIATAKAPLGYEDETGFHFGRQDSKPQEDLPYRVPKPKLA
jgi:hypothetical protein